MSSGVVNKYICENKIQTRNVDEYLIAHLAV